MDIKAVIANVTNYINCSICNEVYEDPRRLPSCNHSFCLHCLQDLAVKTKLANNDGNLTCPDCKKPAKLSLETTELLPKSLFINSLLDVFTITKYGEGAVKCNNCDKNSNQCSYCFICCVFFCLSCLTAHNVIKETKTHRVLVLHEVKEKDLQEVIERPGFCSVRLHEQEVLKFYCQSCDVPACQRCVTVEHANHGFEHLEEKADRTRLELLNNIKRGRDKLTSESQVVEKFEEIVKMVEHKREMAEKLLTSQANMAAKLFELKIQEVNEAAEEKTQEFEETKEDIIARIQESSEDLKFKETLVKGASPTNVVTNLKDEVNNEVAKILKRPLEAAHSVYFEYIPNNDFYDILKAGNIGEVEVVATDISKTTVKGQGLSKALAGIKSTFTIETRNSKGKLIYCATDVIAVEVNPKGGESNQGGVVEIVDCNNAGEYRVTFIVSYVGNYEVAVRINARGLKGSPFLCKAKQRAYNVIANFGQEGEGPGQFDMPMAIAVSNDDHIAVLDRGNRRVQVFTREGKFLRQFGDDVNFSTSLFGITYMKDGKLLVSDFLNFKVEMFSESGVFLKTFCKRGTNENQLVFGPNGLSVDNEGNVIICELRSCRLLVLSPQGDLVRIIKVRADISKGPLYCVYHNGLYFVTCINKRLVKVFNESGQEVNEFGVEECDADDVGYLRIGTDKQGNILVCDTDNSRLRVFDSNGLFIRDVIFKDKNRELKWPRDVKVLRDGRLAVSDGDRKRIQILE